MNHYKISNKHPNHILRLKDRLDNRTKIVDSSNYLYKNTTTKLYKAAKKIGIYDKTLYHTYIIDNMVYVYCHSIHTWKGRRYERVDYIPFESYK